MWVVIIVVVDVTAPPPSSRLALVICGPLISLCFLCFIFCLAMPHAPGKRFANIDVENNEENRQRYRVRKSLQGARCRVATRAWADVVLSTGRLIPTHRLDPY